MKAGLPVKIAFWAAIFVASLWLLISIAFGAAAVLRLLPREYVPGGHSLPEILIVLVLALQPFLILFLIVRAIRLRDQDSAARKILRALCPLVLATLVVADFSALKYLESQFWMRVQARKSTGSMSYLCSLNARSSHPGKRAAALRLGERRHPGKLSTWTLSWPGEKSVTATSFEANTQNIGGSEGISWRDVNGQSMVAYMKFGDLVTMYGANGFLLKVVQSDVRDPAPDFIAKHPTVYYCKPDALYYHE